MGRKKRYTEADKVKVIRLMQLGLRDHEIAKNTGFSVSWVGNQTTEYWKQKMLNKNEK
jgi:hypothetical protein